MAHRTAGNRKVTAVDVSRAHEGDLAGIVRIDSRIENWPERRAFIERAVTAGECFVARLADRRICGFATFDRSFFEQPFVSLLYVDETRRREGVATALIERIEAICPGEKLFTSTNRSNGPMQRLCEKLGFVRSGYVENLDEGDPEIVYFKRLPGRAVGEGR